MWNIKMTSSGGNHVKMFDSPASSIRAQRMREMFLDFVHTTGPWIEVPKESLLQGSQNMSECHKQFALGCLAFL